MAASRPRLAPDGRVHPRAAGGRADAHARRDPGRPGRLRPARLRAGLRLRAMGRRRLDGGHRERRGAGRRRSTTSARSPPSTAKRSAASAARCCCATSSAAARRRAWMHPNRSGFVIARAGHRATQVGPLVGRRRCRRDRLLGHVLARDGRAASSSTSRCAPPPSPHAGAARLRAPAPVRPHGPRRGAAAGRTPRLSPSPARSSDDRQPPRTRRVRARLFEGPRDPGPSARPRRPAPARRAPPARARALLPRRRRRRPRGRRAHDAVRDPRAPACTSRCCASPPRRRATGSAWRRRRRRCSSPASAARRRRRSARRSRARSLGYQAGLLSLAALKGAGDDALIEHCRAVADEIPLIGFYLQPAVGGLDLGADFWARFAAIDNVVAIKVAPFNRYRTLDVIRGVVAAGAEERVTLYTGNDDHIVLDLRHAFAVMRDGEPVTRPLRRRPARPLVGVDALAVQLLERCQAAARSRRAPSAPSCSRSTAASPTATAPSSTSPTTSTAASPAATRCCAGKAC